MEKVGRNDYGALTLDLHRRFEKRDEAMRGRKKINRMIWVGDRVV